MRDVFFTVFPFVPYHIYSNSIGMNPLMILLNNFHLIKFVKFKSLSRVTDELALSFLGRFL